MSTDKVRELRGPAGPSCAAHRLNLGLLSTQRQILGF